LGERSTGPAHCGCHRSQPYPAQLSALAYQPCIGCCPPRLTPTNRASEDVVLSMKGHGHTDGNICDSGVRTDTQSCEGRRLTLHSLSRVSDGQPSPQPSVRGFRASVPARLDHAYAVSLFRKTRAFATPDMGLRSGTAIIFCINAKDDDLCEAVPNFSKKSGRQVTACRGWLSHEMFKNQLAFFLASSLKHLPERNQNRPRWDTTAQRLCLAFRCRCDWA
jgi:hypothetical protein